jgi:excisionase family DNA binding protein
LRVPPYRVCELVREGLLPAIRLGRQIRVDKHKLLEFLESGGRALPGGWRRRIA